jgi:tetratricopeptide (TPR) repeat protein
LGFNYLALGNFEEAIKEFQQTVRLTGGQSYAELSNLAAAYASAGRKAEALAILKDLEEQKKKEYVPAMAISVIHGFLGNRDESFLWLEKAFEERSPYLPYMKVSTYWDPIRDDPRFQDILRRMNFPE